MFHINSHIHNSRFSLSTITYTTPDFPYQLSHTQLQIFQISLTYTIPDFPNFSQIHSSRFPPLSLTCITLDFPTHPQPSLCAQVHIPTHVSLFPLIFTTPDFPQSFHIHNSWFPFSFSGCTTPNYPYLPSYTGHAKKTKQTVQFT